MQYIQKNIDFRSIKEMPRDDRPRERLLRLGPKGVSDLELLCAVLGSGSNGRPVQDIASDILDVMDGGGVSPEDFRNVPGLGMAKAASICAGLELGRRMMPSRLRSVTMSPLSSRVCSPWSWIGTSRMWAVPAGFSTPMT